MWEKYMQGIINKNKDVYLTLAVQIHGYLQLCRRIKMIYKGNINSLNRRIQNHFKKLLMNIQSTLVLENCKEFSVGKISIQDIIPKIKVKNIYILNNKRWDL